MKLRISMIKNKSELVVMWKLLNQSSILKLEMPIIVTENGIADDKDDRRKLFINRYLYALFQAMQDGLIVNGYFYWSLMDNFEWAEGYSMKFGLYEVDFSSQERNLRNGSQAYKEIMKMLLNYLCLKTR